MQPDSASSDLNEFQRKKMASKCWHVHTFVKICKFMFRFGNLATLLTESIIGIILKYKYKYIVSLHFPFAYLKSELR